MTKPTANVSDEIILITARRMHRLSLQRGYFFYTNLFKNPPWLIMLDLFVCSRSNMVATKLSIKIANKLTDEELELALGQLVEAGMVARGDEDFVELTPLAQKQLDGFLREILASRDAQA